MRADWQLIHITLGCRCQSGWIPRFILLVLVSSAWCFAVVFGCTSNALHVQFFVNYFFKQASISQYRECDYLLSTTVVSWKCGGMFEAWTPQLLVRVFVLSSDYRTACYLARCKSNLPFGQCNLASGRNIQKTELKQNQTSDFQDNVLQYLPNRNKLRRLFQMLNKPVHHTQTNYSK